MQMQNFRSNKYGSRKVTVDGITFDSKKEAKRYSELRLLEKAGQITNLQRQFKFELIPTQREESTEVYKAGPQKGLPKPGAVIETPCFYIADFTYCDGNELIVEDTKGFKTKDYIIKRKLMLHVHGIRIKEI